MGLTKKGRRKLNLEGRQFIWYVAEDDDSADFVLHIASEDKAFIVNYHLNQDDEKRFLIVMGREFGGLTDAGGPWMRVLCPKWEEAGAVGPGAVRRLIEWSLDPRKSITHVDWRGEAIGVV